MRILYITAELPYPLTSGFLRHYYFLRGLAERHEVTLFSATRRDRDESAAAELQRFAKQVVVFGGGQEHSLSEYRRPRKTRGLANTLVRDLRFHRVLAHMQQAIQKFLRECACDLVIFTGKTTFPVLRAIGDQPILIDCCDAAHLRHLWQAQHSPFPRSCYQYCRYLQARRIEQKLIARTEYVVFASRRDQIAVSRNDNVGKVIPNGVDLEYWRRKQHFPRTNTIVFSGVMSYPPNHDAACFLIRKVLPLLRQQIGMARVIIVGRDPSPELVLESKRDPLIEVTGSVPDMRPYIEQAGVYVAPLQYASGIQNKLLEAMAMAIPVVTTDVAASSLRVSGYDLPVVVADTATNLAEHTGHLLRSEHSSARLGELGRRFVEDHYGWAPIVRRLESLCLQAAAGGQLAAGEAA